MQSIHHTNVIHSFDLIWSICVHCIVCTTSVCVCIAHCLRFDLMTFLNYIQQSQILASLVSPRRSVAGCQPRLLRCLLPHAVEVAMATDFYLASDAKH